MPFSFRLVTPQGLVTETQAEVVTVPNQDGQIGILAGHANYIGLVGEGALTVTPAAGKAVVYNVRGGFSQVKNGQVEVLVDQLIS